MTNEPPVALGRKSFALLLEAGQDGQITRVYYLATITGDIADVCRLFVLRAGMLGNSAFWDADKKHDYRDCSG